MQGKKKIFKLFLFLGDIFLMYAAFFLALLLRNNNLINQTSDFIYSFSILYIFWIIIIFILDFYEMHSFKDVTNFFLNLTVFSLFAALLGIAYFYLKPQPNLTPKTILILNIVIFDILFLIWRYVVGRILEIVNFRERVIVIGFCEELKEILPKIERSFYEITALFCPPYLKEKNNCKVLSSKIKTISEIRDLKKIVEEKKIDSIVFAIDFYSNKDLIPNIFSNLPLALNYITFNDFYESMAKKVSLNNLNETWFLEKISKPEDKLDKITKRLFDIIFSFVGLLIFTVSFPVIALIIKLDSKGSIFFKQKRIGKNRKVLTLYKFRTMFEDPNQNKKTWREKNEKSITNVGKVLRKIHMDELPQFISILKGDLSFVGPRPEWIELAKVFEKEIPFYSQRYLVKPGFTGWAQINFPASKSIDEAREKFEYDLYYIKNHSFLLDIGIILKTFRLLVF